LQGSDHSGGVLRGVTQNPLLTHASGMAVARFAFLHLISVRTGMVRAECYYILWAKASNAPHMDTSLKNALFTAEQGRLASSADLQGNDS
jgi:hypothetical protein